MPFMLLGKKEYDILLHSINAMQEQISDLEKLVNRQNQADLEKRQRQKLTDISNRLEVNLAYECLFKLLKDFDFNTVLDIGSGDGSHAEVFVKSGKKVTAIDYGHSPYFKQNPHKIDTVMADFNQYDFGRQFDCVWCSHVLEHQVDCQSFLKKIHNVLKEDGVLAITVPPLRPTIVGGHVSLWNGGLLLYRLILAGFNCSEACVRKYGYNISVIVKKHTIDVTEQLIYDGGDISTIRPYLPKSLEFIKRNYKTGETDVAFSGDILELNWDD